MSEDVIRILNMDKDLGLVECSVAFRGKTKMYGKNTTKYITYTSNDNAFCFFYQLPSIAPTYTFLINYNETENQKFFCRLL